MPRTGAWISIVGVLIGLVAILPRLAAAGGDPTALLRFGQDLPDINSYAVERLGTIVVGPGSGHDGKYFFVQATDPWYATPEIAADLLDQPRYRAQRMLMPVLASGAGLLPDAAVPWSMLVLNGLAVGLGCWAVARVARTAGGSPWLGLAFVLNPGVLLELQVGGAGVIAFALASTAIAALGEARSRQGALWMAAAALARPSMMVCAVGAGAFVASRTRRIPWLYGLISILPATAWGAYVWMRLPAGEAAHPPLGMPFAGLVEAFKVWSVSPIDLLVGVFVLMVLIAVAVQVARRPTLYGSAAVGFVVFVPFLGFLVWSHTDLPRAVAPIFTAFILGLVGQRAMSLRRPSVSVGAP